MALAGDGSVYTWGDNSRGQLGLGDGATATKTVATLIPAVKLSGVIKIASGASHNVALKSDGTVWSWGSNSFGELGVSTMTDSSTPQLVPGLTGVVALAAGGFFNTSTNLANGSFTLGQDKNGTFYAWGSDSTNQLCDGFSGVSHNQLSPQAIATLSPLAKIGALSLSAGCYYGLLLNDDGSVSGWGQNSVGQLGNGATSTVQRSLVEAINFNVFSE